MKIKGRGRQEHSDLQDSLTTWRHAHDIQLCWTVNLFSSPILLIGGIFTLCLEEWDKHFNQQNSVAAFHLFIDLWTIGGKNEETLFLPIFQIQLITFRLNKITLWWWMCIWIERLSGFKYSDEALRFWCVRLCQIRRSGTRREKI